MLLYVGALVVTSIGVGFAFAGRIWTGLAFLIVAAIMAIIYNIT